MFKIKSAYYYFLATKTNIWHIFRKVYFQTKTYNKSLQSKTPKKFNFLPNPYLLTPFNSFKNFSLKISDIEINNFWERKKSINEEKKLHDFFWLNLIDRKNDASIIRKIVNTWIDRNSNYKAIIWENTVISKRIISWILNADIIFSGTNYAFNNNFLKSIVIQSNHLRKNLKFENSAVKRIEALSAILLTGLVFKECEENLIISIKELEILIKEFFDKDGFPLTKNPNDLVQFSKYFILIRECIKDSQKYVPDFLDEIIEKNLSSLKNITSPNNSLPLFNGGVETNLDYYFDFLLNLNIYIKKNKKLNGDIKILKNKKNVIFFDTGSPPKKKFSHSYQCGPLSFEYYMGNEKIITNCGYAYNISKKAILLSRLTSAQSTLSINDTSVVKFERNKILNNAFGNSLKGSFKTSDKSFENNEHEIKAVASHDAYSANFGYIVKRELKIDKKNNDIIGQDELIQKKNIESINFSIRFHLSPGISAVKTIGGNGALIQMSNKKSLIFTTSNEILNIEKSIFLGGNKILNNHCITISGKLINENKIIKWAIRKNI